MSARCLRALSVSGPGSIVRQGYRSRPRRTLGLLLAERALSCCSGRNRWFADRDCSAGGLAEERPGVGEMPRSRPFHRGFHKTADGFDVRTHGPGQARMRNRGCAGADTLVQRTATNCSRPLPGSGVFMSATTVESTHVNTINGGTGRFADNSGTFTITISSVVVSISATSETTPTGIRSANRLATRHGDTVSHCLGILQVSPAACIVVMKVWRSMRSPGNPCTSSFGEPTQAVSRSRSSSSPLPQASGSGRRCCAGAAQMVADSDAPTWRVRVGGSDLPG